MFGTGARSMIGHPAAPRKRRARKSSASGRLGGGAGGPLPCGRPFLQGRLEQEEVRRAGLVSGNHAGGGIAEDPVGYGVGRRVAKSRLIKRGDAGSVWR